MSVLMLLILMQPEPSVAIQSLDAQFISPCGYFTVYFLLCTKVSQGGSLGESGALLGGSLGQFWLFFWVTKDENDFLLG